MLLFQLSHDVLQSLFSDWLQLIDIVYLDSSLTSKRHRPAYLSFLAGELKYIPGKVRFILTSLQAKHSKKDRISRYYEVIRWIIRRKIGIQSLELEFNNREMTETLIDCIVTNPMIPINAHQSFKKLTIINAMEVDKLFTHVILPYISLVHELDINGYNISIPFIEDINVYISYLSQFPLINSLTLRNFRDFPESSCSLLLANLNPWQLTQLRLVNVEDAYESIDKIINYFDKLRILEVSSPKHPQSPPSIVTLSPDQEGERRVMPNMRILSLPPIELHNVCNRFSFPNLEEVTYGEEYYKVELNDVYERLNTMEMVISQPKLQRVFHQASSRFFRELLAFIESCNERKPIMTTHIDKHIKSCYYASLSHLELRNFCKDRVRIQNFFTVLLGHCPGLVSVTLSHANLTINEQREIIPQLARKLKYLALERLINPLCFSKDPSELPCLGNFPNLKELVIVGAYNIHVDSLIALLHSCSNLSRLSIDGQVCGDSSLWQTLSKASQSLQYLRVGFWNIPKEGAVKVVVSCIRLVELHLHRQTPQFVIDTLLSLPRSMNNSQNGIQFHPGSTCSIFLV